MRIAILGSGGTGSMAGAVLQKGGADILLVDPYREHLEKISTEGLYMEKNIGEPETIVMKTLYPAVDCEPFDIVIVLTKGMHTRVAVEQAPGLFGPDTVVITFQNGLGNIENLFPYFKKENIGYGVMHLSGHMRGPGHIWAKLHPLERNSVYFKNVVEGAYEDKFRALEAYFRAGGIGAVFDHNCDNEIWNKVMINCAGNLPCAITRLHTGELSAIDEGLELQKQIFEECVAVADAEGIHFDFDALWNKYVNVSLPAVAAQYPSAALDALNRRATEADYLNGAIGMIGRRHGIPTPVNDTVYKLMKVIQGSYDKQFA